MKNGPLRFTPSSGAKVYCPCRVSIAAIQRRWREGGSLFAILSPRDVLDLCQIKLRPEAFYAPAHQILFDLVAELVDSNKPIDFITLKQALKDRAQLDEIGGPEYLRDLFSFVPSAANAATHILDM